MLNFDFLQKSLEQASPPYFAYNYSKKILCYTLLTDQIPLSGCLYFLRY